MPSLSSLSLFQKTLLSLIPTALLITLCYFWIDPAFAIWADHEKLSRFVFFNWCTHLVDVIMVWSAMYYAYFAWLFSHQKKKHLNRDQQKTYWSLLNIANSVAIAIFIKDALKAPFGRYWPTTWIENNPSLISNHAYGFHCFHQGAIYRSFPSGHTTVAVTFMVVLWLAFPRTAWRWLGVFAATAVIIGLLVNDYHFIGDCIAGAWVGAVVAIYVHESTKNLSV